MKIIEQKMWRDKYTKTHCVTEYKFMDTTVLVIKVHILKQAQPPGNGRQGQDSIINRNDNELHTQICRILSI